MVIVRDKAFSLLHLNPNKTKHQPCGPPQCFIETRNIKLDLLHIFERNPSGCKLKYAQVRHTRIPEVIQTATDLSKEERVGSSLFQPRFSQHNDKQVGNE